MSIDIDIHRAGCAVRAELEALAEAHRRRARDLVGRAAEEGAVANEMLRVAGTLPVFSPDRESDYVFGILAAGFKEAIEHLIDGRQTPDQTLAHALGIDEDALATGADPNERDW